MKKYLMILGVFTSFLFLITAVPTRLMGQHSDAATCQTATKTTQLETEATTEQSDAPPDAAAVDAPLCESYQMLDITSGKTEEIPVREYLIGAVCAEMPATFEPEALKAQAVAAHTYAERQHLLEESKPTPELYGADFSNDSSQYQACFTENQARQYYGENFETSYAKITEAVDAVLPYILQYDGAPIIAAFCSMSAGTTESAEAVWGSPVDYLVPVESSADTTAPRYLDTASFTPDELKEAVTATHPHVTLGDDPATWIQVEKTSDAGTVLSVLVGGQDITGQQLRELLGLRSAAFTVSYENNAFTFTTRGYGHGVGMSQYGANAMAKEGSDWQEILTHYYPGTVVSAGELESADSDK